MTGSNYFMCLVPGWSQVGGFLTSSWILVFFCMLSFLILTRTSILYFSKVWEQERFSLEELVCFKQNIFYRTCQADSSCEHLLP